MPLRHPWLVVEKIPASGEALPQDWQVDGTTGYDFMDRVSAVLHDPAGAAPLDGLWRRIAGEREDYARVLATARRQILTRHLVAEYESARIGLHAWRHPIPPPAT